MKRFTTHTVFLNITIRTYIQFLNLNFIILHYLSVLHACKYYTGHPSMLLLTL